MKSPLRVGVARAPKKLLPTSSKQLESAGIRRKAGLTLAVVSVLAAGTLSALFVDYLADRALLRNAASQRLAAAETAGAAGISTDAISGQAGAAPAAVPSAKAAPGLAIASDTPLSSSSAPAVEATASAEPASAGASSTETAAAPPQDQFVEADDLGADQDAAMAEPETDFADQSGAGPDVLDLPAAQAESDMEDGTFTAAIPTERPESAPAPKPARKQMQVDIPKPAEPKEPDAALPGVEVAALPGVESAAQPRNGGAASGRVARVNKDVNLRSRPENGAQVIVVVPAKASVSVLSCDKWCEVSFNGKRGWVYKSFVTASQAAATPAASAPVRKPKTRSEPLQSAR